MSFLINPYLFGNPLVYTTFDGTNELISMGDVLNFDRTDAFSVSFWYKGTDSNGGFVGKSTTSSSFKGWHCHSSSIFLNFTLNSASGNILQVRSSSQNLYNDDTWKHIVYTYDGSSDTSGVKMYVNGSSVGVTSVSNTLTNSITTAFDFNIGYTKYSGYISGAMDKVIVYNDVLTSGEVTTLYNYGRKKGLIGIGQEVGQWELDTLDPSDEISSNDGTSVNMDSSNIVIG